MSININTKVEDQFYRYKMPKLIAKVEGRGNGIKTVITNMSDISKALSCPPSYPTKFFGCELGSQTILDDANDRYIVNGSHSDLILRDLLDKFIRKYILCPKCELPELVTRVKSSLYQGTCGACGWKGPLDNSHKLATFIIKNPPKNSINLKGKIKSKSSKQQKKEKLKNKKEESCKINNEEKSLKKKDLGENDNDGWLVDVSEEAVRKRREEQKSDLSEAAILLLANEVDYLEISIDERLELFKDFLKSKKSTDIEILDESRRLDVTDYAIPSIIDFIITKDGNLLHTLNSNGKLLSLFCQNITSSQQILLGTIEKLVGISKPQYLTQLNQILQIFYENNLLEEDIIIKWSNQSSSSYVPNLLQFKKIQSHASKFIEWLRNAESETDSENEEIMFTNENKESASVEEIPTEVKSVHETLNTQIDDEIDFANI